MGQPAEITAILRKKLESTPDMRVLLRADKNVRYEYLRAVLVAAADAGASNVTFSVVDRDAPGAESLRQ